MLQAGIIAFRASRKISGRIDTKTVTTIYDLKPAFQDKLRPLTRSLAEGGVTANQITVLAALMSVCYGFIILLFYPYPVVFLMLPVVLFVRMALNAIDGMLAREHGQKSTLGGILNEVTDVISDAALYLPLAIALSPPSWIVLLVVLFSITAEIAGLAAVPAGAERRYDGPFGKSDRALWFGTLCFLLGAGVPNGPWVGVVVTIMLILSVITIINRTKQAVKQAQSTSKKSASKKSGAKKSGSKKTASKKTKPARKKAKDP